MLRKLSMQIDSLFVHFQQVKAITNFKDLFPVHPVLI